MGPITAMAATAYNYFPNTSAKELAFFLMYGRDPVNKLSSILNAPSRYLCDDSGIPDLEALKNMYQMMAQQLYNSRQCYIKDNKYNKVPDHGILVCKQLFPLIMQTAFSSLNSFVFVVL